MTETLETRHGLRYALSFSSLFLLLAMAAAGPETSLLTTLRGELRIEDDLRQAHPNGYYETLINASGSPHPGTDRESVATQPPPFAVIPFRDAGIVEEVPSYLRWRMRPNLDLRWNGIRFRTNRLGYRTPDVDEGGKTYGAETYRIAVFGSSNTMGHGVNDEDTYPRLLERWLNEETIGLPRVEVVNLAVSGDSPTRRLQRLREVGEQLDADWLLADATVFDSILEEEHLQAIVRENIPIPFDFVRGALERSGVTAADSTESFQRKLRDESVFLLDGAYAGWSTEARRLGIPSTVVILPRSDGKVESRRLFRLIRRLTDRYALEPIDLSAAFRDVDADQIQVSRWDNHPGALGHRLLFEALRASLIDRGGLPGLPLPRPRTTD
jgi:hypothetical protein